MTPTRLLLTLALLALALAGGELGRAQDPAPRPPVSVHAGTASGAEVRAALAGVRVVPARPFPGGYDRDCGPSHACSFGTAWSDATDAVDGHNGCDTRNDVLREQLVDVALDPRTHGCKVVGGTLVDPYTGRSIEFARDHSEIEIDHLVPLAYAWDMGASTWSQQRRERFANDTRIELVASWGPANEAKRDHGPGDWLPPDGTFRCEYVLRFLGVVRAYGLAITAADARAVRDVAQTC